MVSETEFNEFVSFYGDDKPTKNSELKRKASELEDPGQTDNGEKSEKCPIKVLRFNPNVSEINENVESTGLDETHHLDENLGLAEVPELNLQLSEEDSFAIVPTCPGPGKST